MKDFGFDMLGVFPYSQEPGTPMGRMPDQVEQHVKQQRVEELMLTQQEIAFAKAKGMVGQSIEVMIDRPSGNKVGAAGTFSARSQSQAPEIDSIVYVKGAKLHPGQFITANVTDFQAYDLVAQVPSRKSKSLPVLAR